MRKWLALLGAVGSLATFSAWSGCGGDVIDTGAGGGKICSPGATRTCVGPGACEGGQQCADDGATWGACACGTNDSSSSGGGNSSSMTGASNGGGGQSGAGGQSGTGGQGGGGVDGELDPQWTPKWSRILGYWKLDEATDASTLADSSGHGNTGKPMGGVALGGVGELGNCARLDGSSGYIATPLNPVLASYTMAAWINPTASAISLGREMRIFSNGSYGTYNGAVDWGLGPESDGQLFILNQVSSGQDVYRALDGNPIGSGAWTHVAVVYSDSDHSVKHYVNGQPVHGGFDPGSSSMRTPSPSSAYAFNIGTSGNNFWFFEGSIDEVAIWSTNLDDADVAQIYQHQFAAHGP